MITLRDVQPEDSEMLRTWRNLPEVAAYMYTDHEITPEEHALWFEGMMRDDSSRYWVITLDGEDVGLLYLYDINRRHRRCYWGFYVASPKVRGRGVGSYTEYTCLRHVFDVMGFNKLCCEVLDGNQPVVDMHKKYGFQQEGYYRQHVIKGGEPKDVVALAMLKEEWEQVKPAMEARLREKGLIP